MGNWNQIKPKVPGRYKTRWATDHTNEWVVTVKRSGRGLTVIPDPPYVTSYPMSDIGEDELEWMVIE